MEITVLHERGQVPVTILRVKGQINAATFEQLQDEAQKAYERGARNILLDLSEVSYMSSAAFRALHYIFKLLRTDTPDEGDEAMKRGILEGTFRSPHLKLVNPSRAVLETIKMAGFDMLLEIHQNVNEAVRSFGATSPRSLRVTPGSSAEG